MKSSFKYKRAELLNKKKQRTGQPKFSVEVFIIVVVYFIYIVLV